MSASFRPTQAFCRLFLGSLALMMLLRSSASFLVRSTRNGTPMSILNAQRRGGAVSARAVSSSFHRGRSVFASVDLGGGVVTRLDKARDVFGDKQTKKSWDYVAHHPWYDRMDEVWEGKVWKGLAAKRGFCSYFSLPPLLPPSLPPSLGPSPVMKW